MEFNDVFSKLFTSNNCTTLKAKYKSRLDFDLFKNSDTKSIDFNDLSIDPTLLAAANLIWYSTCKYISSMVISEKTDDIYIIFIKVGNDFKYETYVKGVKKDSQKVENLIK